MANKLVIMLVALGSPAGCSWITMGDHGLIMGDHGSIVGRAGL